MFSGKHLLPIIIWKYYTTFFEAAENKITYLHT